MAIHEYSWLNPGTFDYQKYFADTSPTIQAKKCKGNDTGCDKGSEDIPNTTANGKHMLENVHIENLTAATGGSSLQGNEALLISKDEIITRIVSVFGSLKYHLSKKSPAMTVESVHYDQLLNMNEQRTVKIALELAHAYYHGKAPKGFVIPMLIGAPKGPGGAMVYTDREVKTIAKRRKCVQQDFSTGGTLVLKKLFFEHAKLEMGKILSKGKIKHAVDTAFRLYLQEGDNACELVAASDAAIKRIPAAEEKGWTEFFSGKRSKFEAAEKVVKDYWDDDEPPYKKLERFALSLSFLSKGKPEEMLATADKETGISSESKMKQDKRQEELDKKIGFNQEPSKARFMEQCYLTHFMDTFAKQSKGSANANRFKHVRVIEAEPGTLITEMNKRAGFKYLSKLTPAQLALLQPKIQLFKVRYGGPTTTESKFVFDTEVTRKDIRTIFETGAGRGGGIGIKNVSYEFLGGDPESSQRVIVVKLSLFVQDIDKFFKEVPTKGIASPLDLIVPSRAKKSIFKNDPADWEYDKATEVHNHKLNVVDHDNFEIKAILGWSLPSSGNGLIPRNLRRAIEKNQLVTMLTLHDHTFDFNQDGSMTISASYNGRIEGLLDDDERTNIFAATVDEKNLAKDLKKKEKEFQGDITKRRNIGATTSPGGTITAGTNKMPQAILKQMLTDDFKVPASPENIAALKHALDNSNSMDVIFPKPAGTKKEIFSRHHTTWKESKRLIKKTNEENIDKKRKQAEAIQEQILQVRHKQHIALWEYLENNNHIHSVQVNKTAMDDYLRESGGQLTSFDVDKKELARIEPVKLSLTPAASAPKAVAQVTAAAAKATKERKDPKSDKSAETANNARPQVVGGNYEFNYIYFGDLIDAALNSISSRRFTPKEKRFRFVLGPMKFGTGDRKVTLSIADIPISLNLFMDFYTENVVKQGKVRWPIMRFIKKVATDLIFGALGGECYEKPVTLSARNPSRLSMEIISFPKDILASQKRWDIKKLPMHEINGNWANSVKSSSIFEYIVLYANFFPLTSRKGNKAEDELAGIYHLELGRDAGLVKEISLSKENKPNLVSDRLARDGKINRIAHPYHADVKMIGNTFFKPGSRVFINPSMTSIGSAAHRNSLVSKLGIGGYYVVLGVTSDLGAGQYETTLRAKWEANGFKTDAKASKPASKPTKVEQPWESIEVPGIFASFTKMLQEEPPEKQAEIRKANVKARKEQDVEIRDNQAKYAELSLILIEYERYEQRSDETLSAFKERRRAYLAGQGFYDIRSAQGSGGQKYIEVLPIEGKKTRYKKLMNWDR